MTGRFMNQGDLYDTGIMHEVALGNESIITSMRFQPYSLNNGVLTIYKKMPSKDRLIELYSVTLGLNQIYNDTMQYNLMEGESIIAKCTDKYVRFTVQGENTPNVKINRCK